jgi:hypothetical protein
MDDLELAAVRGHVSEAIVALKDKIDDDLRDALIHLAGASSSLRLYADKVEMKRQVMFGGKS